MNKRFKPYLFIVIVLLTVLACNFTSIGQKTAPPAESEPLASDDSVSDATSDDDDKDTTTTSSDEGDSDTTAPANTDEAETIFIPGGPLWMGSEEGDSLADEDEMPPHQVTLDGFYLYTHPVTNEMYAECVEDMACMEIDVLGSGPTTNYEDPDAADHPVVGVDWPMARDYCEWAGGRLPTEAEWEYAARGPSTSSEESLTYPWGEDAPTCDHVNMFGCQVPPNTLPVGAFALSNSPFEVWDMSGNVWEWVHDWYGENYYIFSSEHNPLGPGAPEDPDHPLKVVRGGGLYSEPDQMRSAARHGINPARPYDDVGFRCVTPGELDLPTGYTDTDRHERVTPDDPDEGGERAEDPDDPPDGLMCATSFGAGNISCPTAEDRIHVTIETTGGFPDAYTFSVDGDSCDCHYDEILSTLVCDCPAPDAPVFPIALCFENECFSDCGYGFAALPEDCDERGEVPLRHSISLNCPIAGLFNIVFGFEPIITWDTVQLGDIDLDCHLVDLNHLSCTAPDIPDGDHYDFYLHGTSPDGTVYEWTPRAPVLVDCPVDWAHYTVRTACYDTFEPFVDIYHPETEVVESANIGGEVLECYRPVAHLTTCRLPEGLTPDDMVNIEFCYVGGTCFTELVTVLDCNIPSITYGLTPMCWPEDVPAVRITYWDLVATLDSVVVGDTEVDCESVAEDVYICSDIPGAAGDDWSIDICLSDGRCINDIITIPDCELPVLEPIGPWSLVDVGCLSEVDLFAVIDTHIEGEGSTYSINYGGGSCGLLDPPPTGRWFCAIPIPGDPGPLTFCVTPAGGAEICETFDGFPGRVPASCDEPDEPEEPLTCSDYTNQGDCEADSNCYWEMKSGECREVD